MKHTTSLRCNCLTILVFIFIFSSLPIFSNEGQVAVFNAGVNLGYAKARAEFYTREAVESWIIDDLNRTRGNIMAIENEFARFFSICVGRRDQTARILRLIDNYSSATRNFNQHRKMIYIKGIFDMFRSSLALTLDTSRPDSCRSQANCDQHLALAAFSLGEAQILAQSQGSRFRNLQSGRVGLLRDQVRKGIWLSMDIPNQRYQETGIRKICCSFGAKAEWDQHVAGLKSNSPPQAFINVIPLMQATIRAANLRNTPCASIGGDISRHPQADCWYDVKYPARNNAAGTVIKLNSNGTISWFMRSSGQLRISGTWSINRQGDVFTLSVPWEGRFSGTISLLTCQNCTGFKVSGTWDSGRPEVVEFFLTQNPN